MRRILVVGSPGAGKSTLATKLAAKLDLPLHYLDLHHWERGWHHRDAAQTRDSIRAICETATWVMDGNFAESFDLRMAWADTLIWLDYPRATCIRRILMRTIRDYGQSKPDLPDGCPEQFDAALLRFAWEFPLKSRPGIPAGIERFGSLLRVVQLRNDSEAAAFLREAA
jgi:adenylate kinase family enzyme